MQGEREAGPGQLSGQSRLDAARVEALYRVSRPAYYATLANAGILLVALWGPFTAEVLLVWFAALVAVSLGRIALHSRYTRAARDSGGADAAAWERRYMIGALASGAVWSLSAAVFFPAGDPLLQMAVVLVVGASVIGAAGVYAPSPLAFYAFTSLPFAAMLVQLAAQPGRTYVLLALVLLVVGGVMIKVHRDVYRGIVDTLRVQLRNEELHARAAATGGVLRDAIESLPEGIAIWGADDRLVVCNDTYASLYGGGLGAERLAGATFRRIAENAWDAERIAPEFEGRRDEWIERRVSLHREGRGEMNEFQARDGRWRRGGTVRMRRGGLVGLVSDVSGLKRAQEAYLAVLAEENLVLDTLPVGVAFVERHSIVRCNRKLEQMLGYAPDELRGQSTRVWFASDDRWYAAREESYARLADSGMMEGDARVRRKDGTGLWCRVLARAVDASEPEGGSIIFAFTDVDQRVAAEQALQESVEKLQLAVDAADLYYWEWDAATDRLHWGRNPSALPGAPRGGEQKWSEFTQLIHPEDRERCDALHRAALERGQSFANEYRLVGHDGQLLWIAARGVPMREASGKVHRMIGVSQDITERKRQEEEVRFLAYHDSLTGMPNRRLLDDRLKQAVYLAQRRDTKVAVMLIDLDDFKQVNDSVGHRAGDAVLREVAQRLAGCVRKADTLARHGGDEFVVVIPDLQLEADCQIVAEKILHALTPEFQADGRHFNLGASIGISIFPSDAGDGDALLRNADAAMYRAKQLGKNNYRFYGR